MSNLILLVFTLGIFQLAHAEEYQIFDGQTYNNLFYPRVDIIEWGEPLHLEFHIYQKDKPVDVTGMVIERGAKRVFVFAYDMNYRGERRCRAVPAPPHWREGQKLHFYSDKTDNEMNRIIVSAEEINKKKNGPYANKDYTTCVEVAAHSARPKPEAVAKKPEESDKKSPVQRAVASKPKDSPAEEDKTKPSEKEGKEAVAEKFEEKFESDLGAKNLDWFSE